MINLDMMKKYWGKFYLSLGMGTVLYPEINKKISVSSENQLLINGILEQNSIPREILCPPVGKQKRYLKRLTNWVNRMLDPDMNQEIRGVWLSPDMVRLNFPEDVSFLNRPDGFYLSFVDDNPFVPVETHNKRLKDMGESFGEVGQTGQTLFEYLVFWIHYVKFLKKVDMPYPDSSYSNCLLDSRLPDDKILVVKGDKSGKYLKIFAWPLTYNEYNMQGARPTIIVPLV